MPVLTFLKSELLISSKVGRKRTLVFILKPLSLGHELLWILRERNIIDSGMNGPSCLFSLLALISTRFLANCSSSILNPREEAFICLVKLLGVCAGHIEVVLRIRVFQIAYVLLVAVAA